MYAPCRGAEARVKQWKKQVSSLARSRTRYSLLCAQEALDDFAKPFQRHRPDCEFDATGLIMADHGRRRPSYSNSVPVRDVLPDSLRDIVVLKAAAKRRAVQTQ